MADTAAADGLVASILAGNYEDCLVLADWLEERGDGRGKRLRRWFAQHDPRKRPLCGSEEQTSYGSCAACNAHYIGRVTEYVIRLVSVPDGAPLPRTNAGGGYGGSVW